MRYKPET